MEKIKMKKYHVWYKINGKQIYNDLDLILVDTLEEAEEVAEKHFEEEEKNSFNLWRNHYEYYAGAIDDESIEYLHDNKKIYEDITTNYKIQLEDTKEDLERTLNILGATEELLHFEKHAHTEDYLYEKTGFYLTGELSDILLELRNVRDKIAFVLSKIEREL